MESESDSHNSPAAGRSRLKRLADEAEERREAKAARLQKRLSFVETEAEVGRQKNEYEPESEEEEVLGEDVRSEGASEEEPPAQQQPPAEEESPSSVEVSADEEENSADDQSLEGLVASDHESDEPQQRKEDAESEARSTSSSYEEDSLVVKEKAVVHREEPPSAAEDTLPLWINRDHFIIVDKLNENESESSASAAKATAPKVKAVEVKMTAEQERKQLQEMEKEAAEMKRRIEMERKRKGVLSAEQEALKRLIIERNEKAARKTQEEEQFLLDEYFVPHPKHPDMFMLKPKGPGPHVITPRQTRAMAIDRAKRLHAARLEEWAAGDMFPEEEEIEPIEPAAANAQPQIQMPAGTEKEKRVRKKSKNADKGPAEPAPQMDPSASTQELPSETRPWGPHRISEEEATERVARGLVDVDKRPRDTFTPKKANQILMGWIPGIAAHFDLTMELVTIEPRESSNVDERYKEWATVNSMFERIYQILFEQIYNFDGKEQRGLPGLAFAVVSAESHPGTRPKTSKQVKDLLHAEKRDKESRQEENDHNVGEILLQAKVGSVHVARWKSH